jgi:OOP family OmpA-OmpF porin
LATFEGETTVFEEISYILDNCLQAQFKKEKQKPAYFLWIILVSILLLMGAWSFSAYREHRRWSNYVSDLRSEPGFVITNVAKKDGKHHIFGLRDPLAPDPVEKLVRLQISPEQVLFHWEPYQSYWPQYALQRIDHILIPPETIRLDLKNGVLHASGWAPHQWITETRKRVTALPGVEKYNDAEVIDIDAQLKPPPTVFLELDGRTLYARGTAPHQWITKTRNTIKATQGDLDFNDDRLTDMDLKQLHRIKKEIEQQAIFFKAGRKELVAGQEDAVEKLVKQLKEFDSLALLFRKKYHIEIIGHTDQTGIAEKNLQISKERAEIIFSILVAKGLTASNFIPKGVGSTEPLPKEIHEKNGSSNRRVSLKAIVAEK